MEPNINNKAEGLVKVRYLGLPFESGNFIIDEVEFKLAEALAWAEANTSSINAQGPMSDNEVTNWDEGQIWSAVELLCYVAHVVYDEWASNGGDYHVTAEAAERAKKHLSPDEIKDIEGL